MALRLRCAVQNYAWGKPGNKSEVAQLSLAADPNFRVDDCATYAELWMGTHPSGPSYILHADSLQSVSLQAHIEDDPDILGENIRQQFGDQLPFLFKVLSVNVALSIQAHPDKLLAKQLHNLHPDVYKDANHKPEMAIALTPFEALCGFRPLAEVSYFLCRIPELCDVIGAEAAASFTIPSHSGSVSHVDLKNAFTALMTCKEDIVRQKLAELLCRLQLLGQQNSEYIELHGNLLVTLNAQFPGDVGCFCIYFLNYMTLQPGEAIFLEANLPHAYLSGDCVECMACSDNVVRAGLTPKFKDVDTLCSMLNYESKSGQEFLFPATPRDKNILVYDPPVPDFTVHKIEVPSVCGEIEGSCYCIGAELSASLLLVVSGEASTTDGTIKLTRGTVHFLPANTQLALTVTSKADTLVIFRALCSI